MVTTIQIDERTLMLLKRLKQKYAVKSYQEAIIRNIMQKTENQSMAGSLNKYVKKGETMKDMLKELQEERRKSDRF